MGDLFNPGKQIRNYNPKEDSIWDAILVGCIALGLFIIYLTLLFALSGAMLVLYPIPILGFLVTHIFFKKKKQ